MASTLIDVVAQVSTVVALLFVMPAVGGADDCVAVMLAVDVQPFEPVTVTVYVPGAVMLADAALPNPLSHA